MDLNYGKYNILYLLTMSKYVPPSMRKQTTSEPKVETNNFPELGNSTVTTKQSIGSYAEKAEEWRIQRLEIEEKERIERYKAEIKAERAVRQRDEDAYILRRSVVKKAEKPKIDTTVVAPTTVADPDGWTTVQKKPRKERKDAVNFEEIPEEMSSDSEAHEYEYQDRSSLWN